MRQFRGRLERVTDSVVVGWAQCDEGGDPHVQFRLRINNVDSGPYVAKLFRDDLRQAMVGTGHHGFEVFVADHAFRPGDNTIELYGQPENLRIGDPFVYHHNPAAPTAAPVAPVVPPPVPVSSTAQPAARRQPASLAGARAVRGRLERVQDGVISGWLFNQGNPAERVRFGLYMNGEEIGVHRADDMRGDLLDAGIGDGAHGFSIDLPDERLKAGDNRIEVRLMPEGSLVDVPLIYSYTPPPGAAERLAEPTSPPSSEQAAESSDPVPPTLPDKPKGKFPRFAEIRYRGKPEPGKQPNLTRESVGTLINAMLGREGWKEKDVYALIEEQAKAQNWQLLSLICDGLPDDFGISARILTWQGRAALYLGDLEQAAHIFERIYDLDPRKHAALFYLGVTYARLSRWADAVRVFEACVKLEPEKETKYYLELGRALIRVGFGSYGVFGEDRTAMPRAVEMIEKAVAIDPGNVGALRELAMLYLHLLRYDEALAMSLEAVKRGKGDLASLIELTRVYVRLNLIDEALETSQKALGVAPNNDTCKFNHRIISRLVETFRPRAENGIAILVDGSARDLADPGNLAEIIPIEGRNGWGEAVLTATGRWVMFGFDPSRDVAQTASRLAAIGYDWAAGVRDQGELRRIVWRRDYLLSLLQAGIIDTHSDLDQIERVASLYARISDSDVSGLPDLTPTPAGGRTVLLFSQYGVRKFGGGEHFLQQMAHIYRDMGYNVLVIGTQAELVGEEGEVNGLRYRFIDKSPQEFVRLIFEEKPILAHMISGLAFEVTAAFRFFNISLIHGIHFWRDMLAPPTPSSGYYPDVDFGDVEGRPEFNGVIRDSEVVYANSHYTRHMVETMYGMRPPILFSLPDNVEPEDTGEVVPDGRDFVLLANARGDKGFDLFIQTAKRVPHIRFCAIASQSSRDVAQAQLAREGVNNVELLDHVADMTTLYRQARVVAVPSYRFVETFSRVVIEAQRFGVPVIGSDTGNVPYLLIESGVSLAEDPDLWAREIDRLFDDDDHWLRQSQLALENSERYSFNMQARRLGHLVAAVDKPLLIGVGSGLGNIIHTAPMIRNLALRTGRPVDVVMAGDHKDMLFVLGKRDYVNHAFVLNEDVLNRRYEAVFITHCFGTAIPHFATNRLLQSRSWKIFHPGSELHETEFNLAAAKAVLGVDYDPEDISQYFLGDYVWEKPNDLLVGIHAGSKGGIWGAKRWPGYGAMAHRLMARGIRVASFGTPDEYVDGTENRTGGTIEEMTRAMLSCSHFVANDSGVMNVANALGIPLVSLFAPTNVKTRGPLGPNSQSIAIARDCSPCELDTSKDSKFTNALCDCIGGISVDEVLKVLNL